MLKFFNDDFFDSCINHTFIALIPKVKDPVNAYNFRHISLCNSIYKLVSKILANRLKQIMPVIISKNQSVFLLGRLITNNIITVYEALYFMKTRQKEREGSMVIKLDIFKAYDILEWSFLKTIIHKLIFNDMWISRIMTCVSIFSYSILVNGQPS